MCIHYPYYWIVNIWIGLLILGQSCRCLKHEWCLIRVGLNHRWHISSVFSCLRMFSEVTFLQWWSKVVEPNAGLAYTKRYSLNNLSGIQLLPKLTLYRSLTQGSPNCGLHLCKVISNLGTANLNNLIRSTYRPLAVLLLQKMVKVHV